MKRLIKVLFLLFFLPVICFAVPVEISTLAELQAINEGLSADYELVNDIDASVTNPDNVSLWSSQNYISGSWVKYDDSGTVKTYYCHTNTVSSAVPTDTDYWTEMWASADGWLPIGNDTYKFTGSFDGGGFTISDLYIDRSSTDYVGLFGANDYATSSIVNLKLVNVDITGYGYTGGLIGNGGGTITNCSVSGGTIHSSRRYVGGLMGMARGTITQCWSNVTTSATQYSVGGLIGRAYYATISSSYAKGNTSGTYNVGGLIGQHYRSTTTNSYAWGNVSGTYDVGGLIGQHERSTSQNCYAWGNVTGNTTGQSVGGFVGETAHSTDNIDYCYSTGKPTNNGTGGIGAFCGDAYDENKITQCFYDSTTSETTVSDGGTAKTTAEMKTLSTFTGASWDIVDNSAYVNETWKIVPTVTYPMLGWEEWEEYVIGIRKDSFFHFLLQ